MSAEVRELAAETAGQLRSVLASVDAGELEAELDQVAYMRGAADALTALVGRPSR
jgi:hypothetical protein